MIASGKQAIVLIPEDCFDISDTAPFYLRFGDRGICDEFQIVSGERSDKSMNGLPKGEIDIMIECVPRYLRLFERLGLVIIDEEHESSYKSETMPKFHAREVAQELCRMKHASLLLGSATPSLESYYRARQGEIPLFTLNSRLTGGELPRVYVET